MNHVFSGFKGGFRNKEMCENHFKRRGEINQIKMFHPKKKHKSNYMNFRHKNKSYVHICLCVCLNNSFNKFKVQDV